MHWTESIKTDGGLHRLKKLISEVKTKRAQFTPSDCSFLWCSI